jgi:hypothetical protein
VDSIEETPIMRSFHLALADPRRLLLGLMIGCICAAVGCGEGGGSAGNAASKKGEEIKQRKLDSMKEIMQKKLGAKRSP